MVFDSELILKVVHVALNERDSLNQALREDERDNSFREELRAFSNGTGEGWMPSGKTSELLALLRPRKGDSQFGKAFRKTYSEASTSGITHVLTELEKLKERREKFLNECGKLESWSVFSMQSCHGLNESISWFIERYEQPRENGRRWKELEWLSNHQPEETQSKTPAELLNCFLSLRKKFANSRDSDVTGSFFLLSVRDALKDIRRLEFADIPDVPERPENVERARWALDRIIEWLHVKNADIESGNYPDDNGMTPEWMTFPEIVEYNGLQDHRDAVRKRLERFRKGHDGDFREVENRRANESKYQYRTAAISDLLTDLLK